jgi:hypothetical protein
MPMRTRASADWNLHLDKAVTVRGLFAAEKNSVRIANDGYVRKCSIFRIDQRKLPFRVVGGDS